VPLLASAAAAVYHCPLLFCSFSDITERHRRLAEIIEMIHTASLVHDDVLDDCSVRRGEQQQQQQQQEAQLLLQSICWNAACRLCCGSAAGLHGCMHSPCELLHGLIVA
jgi:geranylgeranyl pyrophosphate synthase